MPVTPLNGQLFIYALALFRGESVGQLQTGNPLDLALAALSLFLGLIVLLSFITTRILKKIWR